MAHTAFDVCFVRASAVSKGCEILLFVCLFFVCEKELFVGGQMGVMQYLNNRGPGKLLCQACWNLLPLSFLLPRVIHKVLAGGSRGEFEGVWELKKYG